MPSGPGSRKRQRSSWRKDHHHPDYLKEVDAWYQANLNMNIHRIMAVQAAIETRLLAGKP
ncbi:MAG: hypothetical protein R2787_17525 [Saprospiraceae bacterium]